MDESNSTNKDLGMSENIFTKCKKIFKIPQDPKKRKKFLIIWGVILAVIVGALSALALQLSNIDVNSKEGLFGNNFADKLKGDQEISDLDGLEYDTEVANRRPIAVMIENHPEARPQFGLTRASIVYESVAEGGITRYMAIFGPKDADRVGPVRSARTYFVEWMLEYKAIYAHAGGAANALDLLREVRAGEGNIDHAGEPVMWRQRRGSEASEHTLYGSTVFMRSYAKDVNWNLDADFVPWLFKEKDARSSDERMKDTITAIHIPFSGSYKVDYLYDAADNTWARSLAGKKDIDAATDEQIKPTNIVVLTIARSEVTSAGKTVGQLDLYTQGDAQVFQDGKMIEGYWKKEGRGKKTKIFDNDNKEIRLSPGQTFVTIIQPGMTVTYDGSELTKETPAVKN